MKNTKFYIAFLSLLTVIGCYMKQEQRVKIEYPESIDTTKKTLLVESFKDSAATTEKCHKCFSVTELPYHKELGNWDFTYNENSNFRGFKDYNYHDLYIVSEHLKFSPSDTMFREAWALVLGYQPKDGEGKEEPIFKEIFLIPNFKKHSKLATYKNNSDVGPEEISSYEFLFLDTIPIYEISKEAVYLQSDMEFSVSYIGYQLRPKDNGVADYFLLGKQKYELIRNK